jgi:hypothetical protein
MTDLQSLLQMLKPRFGCIFFLAPVLIGAFFQLRSSKQLIRLDEGNLA